MIQELTSPAVPAAPAKFKFVAEFAINASPRLLYPYLSTAGSLAQWLCDDVRLTPDHHFNFIWDGESHFASVANVRPNRSVRYVFLDAKRQPVENPSYIDLAIETSQLTDEVFLRVIDYSEETDVEELRELWEGLTLNLRELIGG